jgi:hypothetical protein
VFAVMCSTAVLGLEPTWDAEVSVPVALSDVERRDVLDRSAWPEEEDVVGIVRSATSVGGSRRHSTGPVDTQEDRCRIAHGDRLLQARATPRPVAVIVVVVALVAASAIVTAAIALVMIVVALVAATSVAVSIVVSALVATVRSLHDVV